MEKRISISSDIGTLDGILSENSKKKGIIITHPHPLYGGNMENTVVHTVASVYKSKDYTTLRFNFRGVGESSGSYNEGIGEQTDLITAIGYLEGMGIENIELAGYSFGSWVIQQLVKNEALSNRLVLISPPIDFMQFDESMKMDNLDLVVSGSHDEYAVGARLNSVVKDWNPDTKFKIVEGADHFYSGHLSNLAKALTER